MTVRTFILSAPRSLESLQTFLGANWLQRAESDKPLVVTVQEWKAKRTLEQNKRMHAVFSDIAEQVWVEGRQFSVEVWKEYYKREFLPSEEMILPTGEIVNQPISTTKLTVPECADFMTQVDQRSAEAGVVFRDDAASYLEMWRAINVEQERRAELTKG